METKKIKYIVFCSAKNYKNSLNFKKDFYTSGVDRYWQIAESKDFKKIFNEFCESSSGKYDIKKDWNWYLDIILQGYEIKTLAQVKTAEKWILSNELKRNGYKIKNY